MDDNIIAQAKRLTSETRQEVAMAIGVLRGIKFDAEELDHSRPLILEALENLEVDLDNMEKYLVVHELRDKARLRDLIPKMRADAEAGERLGAQLYTAAIEFERRAEAVKKEKTADVAQLAVALRVHAIKKWLAFISVLYVISYLVGIVVVYVRSKPEKKSPLILP